MDDKNIDITFATMGDVMSYQAYNPTGGFVESSGIFDDDGITDTMTVKASDGKDYTYIPFGADNLLPYQLIKSIGESSVMAQNKLFNVLTCYGLGFQYNDIKTKLPSDDKDVNLFKMHNSLSRFFLEQITDMKYFFFCVSAIILNKKGDRIVAVRHKEACYCRFTQSKNGRSEYVLYANWRNALEPENIEAIPLLDELDPLGDLQERMGLKGQSGQVKSRQGGNGPRTKARVFAIVTRFPTAGCQYYPVPYYSAIFRDKWYDISRLIAIGKCRSSETMPLSPTSWKSTTTIGAASSRRSTSPIKKIRKSVSFRKKKKSSPSSLASRTAASCGWRDITLPQTARRLTWSRSLASTPLRTEATTATTSQRATICNVMQTISILTSWVLLLARVRPTTQDPTSENSSRSSSR